MDNIQMSLTITASVLMLIIICLGIKLKKKHDNRIKEMIYLQQNITPYLRPVEDKNYQIYNDDTDSNKSYTVDDINYMMTEKSHISDKSFISNNSDYNDSKSLTMTQIRLLSKEENNWLKDYMKKNNDNSSFIFI
jgi:hypothetical protein